MNKKPVQSKNKIIKRRRPYKKKKFWKNSEELLLLSLWSERLDELLTQRKNAYIYDQIRDELATADCIVSSDEIRFKLNNITAKYKKEKEECERKGTPSAWIFYKNVDKILGNQNTTKNVKNKNSEGERINQAFEFSELMIAEPYEVENKNDELLDSSMSPKRESFAELTNEDILNNLSDPDISIQTGGSEESLHEQYSTEPQEITNFQQRLLDKMDNLHYEMVRHNEIMVQQREKILEQEEKRTRVMKRFLMESIELKDAFMYFLGTAERGSPRS